MRHLGGDVLVGEVRGVASVGGGVRGGVARAQDPSVGLGEEREIFASFVADVRVEAVGAGVVRSRAAYTLGHRSVGEAYRARLRIPERGWDGGRWGSAFELLGHRVKDGTPFCEGGDATDGGRATPVMRARTLGGCGACSVGMLTFSSAMAPVAGALLLGLTPPRLEVACGLCC